MRANPRAVEWQTGRVSESRRPAVVRGFASSTLAIFVALAGHVTGGGAMPGVLGIAVPWILASMVCVLLAGRKLSVVRLGLAVGASQFLFHTLFVLGTVTTTGAVAPHVHGSPLVLPAGTGVPETVVADGSMWLGHAAATLLTVLVLLRAERLVHAICDLAVRAARWVRSHLDVIVAGPSLPGGTNALGEIPDTISATSSFLATLRGRAPPLVLAF